MSEHKNLDLMQVVCEMINNETDCMEVTFRDTNKGIEFTLDITLIKAVVKGETVYEAEELKDEK